MHIGGSVVELVSERAAAGYRVVVVGYVHRKVVLYVDGRPRVTTQTATTGPITLTTDAGGAFSANPTTPSLPPVDDDTEESYYSASATVYSASGAILATDEKTSPAESFTFAFTVPFQLEPGRLAIGGHVTEDWSGLRAVGYEVSVLGFTKAVFHRTVGFADNKPPIITAVNDTPPIALTTDANGHFFTDPQTPPIPTLHDPDYELGMVTYGATVTVSANGIALATSTKNVAIPAVGFALELAGWTSIGPKNFTCVIMSLAVHPTIPSIVYAGAQYGGVWKTTDGGMTWRPTMDTQSNLYVGAVGLCTAQPNVVYAAMQSSAEYWPQAGLYRSSDGGATWQARTPVASVCNVGTLRNLQLAVHPTNPDTVYVAGTYSLHRSDDGGLTWPVRNTIVDGVAHVNRSGIFDGTIVDVKLDPDHPDTIYIAVTGRGVFSSSDGGATWTRLGANLQFPVQYEDSSGHTQIKNVGLDGSYRCALALGGPVTARRLVAKVQGTILISDDRGQSWRVVAGTDHGYEPDSPEWDSCVAVMPGNRDVIVAGGDGMAATFDGGETWSGVNALHEDQQSIAFVSNQPAFYFSNDGLIGHAQLSLEIGPGLRLVPKFETSKVSDGLVASQCFNVSVSQTAPVVAGCSTYHTGILRTGREQLDKWEDIAGAEGGLFEIDPTNENKIFCGPWAQPHLKVSKDGGSTFSDRNLMFRGATGQDQPAYPVALGIKPDDGNRLYAGAFFGWLYYSLDGGDTWDHVKDAAGNPLLPVGGTEGTDRIGAFAFAPSNTSIVYAGTTNGRLWRTTSAATTAAGWQQLNAPDPTITDWLWSIAVHPTDPNTVYVGYGKNGPNRVWRGTQQASGTFAWTLASGSGTAALPAIAVSALVCDPLHASHVFAATGVGVYTTADAGTTWHPLRAGMPNTRIVDLRLRRQDHTLYAAAVGRGIFRWQLP